MNTSNQSLLKGIKIFFKVVYIFLIVIIIINVISQSIILLVDKDHTTVLSIVDVITQPDICYTISGEETKPELVAIFGAITIKGVSPCIRTVNILGTFLNLLLFVFIINIIRNIIRSTEQSEVFTLLNARRLRNIGKILLLVVVLSFSLMIGNSLALNTLEPTNTAYILGMIFGESIGYIMAIVFTFFMAAVFKIGVNIQEENQSFV
ncbi:MAG: DUF2975 domain-containing protein [Bacteroidales bacterium]|nr:DUF2975 domain-containing protein [Bacteroidales bacterium]